MTKNLLRWLLFFAAAFCVYIAVRLHGESVKIAFEDVVKEGRKTFPKRLQNDDATH